MHATAWARAALASFFAAALGPAAFGASVSPAPLWSEDHRAPGSAGLNGSVSATRMLADGSMMVAIGNSPGITTVRYDAAGTELSRANLFPRYSRVLALDPFGALFVFASAPVNGSELWVMKYDGISGHALWPLPAEVHVSGNTFHDAVALAVDARGDVVATGDAGAGAALIDWATFKLDGRTGAVLWGPVVFDGSAHDRDIPSALALDAAGDAFVTGQSSNGVNSDFATVKYSGSTGAVLWGPQVFNGPSNGTDTPVALAVDPSGDVVVSGTSQNSPNSSIDFATVKYAGATGAAKWGPVFLTPAIGRADVVQAIAVDPRGNVFVTGSRSALGNLDWATVRYDSQTGALTWGPVTFDGGPSDAPIALAADANGDLFVTGKGSNSDFVTFKYDGGSGAADWGPIAFNVDVDQPLARGLLLDAAGDVVVTGTSGTPRGLATLKYAASNGATLWGPVTLTGDLGLTVAPVGMTTDAAGNVFTIDTVQVGAGAIYSETRKLAAGTGALLWATQSPAYVASGIAVDGAGNPVVAFAFVNAASYVETRTVKFDGATGNPIWTATFQQSGSFSDNPRAVSVDASGNVLVSGTAGAGASASIFTWKYNGATGAPIWGPTLSATLPNSPVLLTFLQKVDPGGNLVVVTDGYAGTGSAVDSFLTVKISGSTGGVLWGPNSFIDAGWAFPTGLALDASGNAFVSGHSYGGTLLDLVVLKYASADGATLWGPARYHFPGAAGFRPAVAVDSAGDVFLSGSSSDSPSTIATLKYNGATGGLLWGPSLFVGASTEAIEVDGSGGVVVLGREDNFNPDFLLLKYAGADGSVVWGPVVTDTGPDDRAIALRLVGDEPVAYGGIDVSVTVRYSLALIVSTPAGELPPARCGVAYASSLAAQNGTGAYTWTLVSGALPGGLSLDATGAITGTASAEGTFAFRARVTDASSTFSERDFSVTVEGNDPFIAAVGTPNPICPGDSVTLSVPGSWSSYLWLRGGETTPTIQVSPHASAEYGVLLGGGSGCSTHGWVRVVVGAPVFGTAAGLASIAPTSGVAAGPVALEVTGSSFASGSTAAVGGIASPSVAVTSCTLATATTPPLGPGTLNDVAWINPGASTAVLTQAFFADFLDVSQSHPFHAFVEKLVRHAVTAGCGSGGYCPSDAVTRAQISVFLLRSQDGPGYVPPACSTAPFADVPCTSPFAPWIRELSMRGVTAGCGGGNYCPGSPVTRGQMAVFLLRTKDGAGYVPPPCSTPPFADVPCSNGFAIWIQELVARGITAGCGSGNYCPVSPVTRGQMAVFLVTTFGLS